MKSVFFFSLLSLTSVAWSAQEWKVVAESTTNCKEKVKVLAKEGEKFVYVDDGQTKTKLMSEDGSAYSEASGSSVVFSNQNDKMASNKFTYTQPSMVDGNPPKLNVAMDQSRDNCKMKLK